MLRYLLPLVAILCLASPASAQPKSALTFPKVAPEPRLINTYPLDPVLFKSWDQPAAPLQPIRIVAPIGGVSTAQLLATQDGGVKNLTFKLTAPQGWPADTLTARFQTTTSEQLSQWRDGGFLPRLTDTNPAHPIVPIRLIARVPRDAKPGLHTGKIAVTLDGKTHDVTVNIEAGPFTIPDKGQWRSHFDIYQSPEVVARFYKTPLWSPEHWVKVEASLKLMADYPTHVLWVPLKSSGLDGLTESMVRYEKRNNTWHADASRVEKYFELYDRHLGEPKSIACFVWGGDRGDVHAIRGTQEQLANCSFKITTTDGKEQTINSFTPEAAAIFKAGFDAVRAAVTKRKWSQDSVHIGLAMDPIPSKFFVDFLKEPSNNASWVRHAHDQARNFAGVPVAYCATARNQADWDGPFYKNPRTIVAYSYGEGPMQGLARSYAAPGEAFSARLHGMAGPMADFWTGVLWIGGQPTMKMYGQYLFQPGPNGAEHSMFSLNMLHAAQAAEAAYQLSERGQDKPARDFINWSRNILYKSKRYDWPAHEKEFQAEKLQDLESALYQAAGK